MDSSTRSLPTGDCSWLPIPLEPGHLPEDTGRGAVAGIPRQAGDSQVLPNFDGPTFPTTGMDHPRLRQIQRTPALTPAVEELVQYMETQWIQSTTFPVSSWSVYQRQFRTNNDVEGYQNRLNCKAR